MTSQPPSPIGQYSELAVQRIGCYSRLDMIATSVSWKPLVSTWSVNQTFIWNSLEKVVSVIKVALLRGFKMDFGHFREITEHMNTEQ